MSGSTMVSVPFFFVDFFFLFSFFFFPFHRCLCGLTGYLPLVQFGTLAKRSFLGKLRVHCKSTRGKYAATWIMEWTAIFPHFYFYFFFLIYCDLFFFFIFTFFFFTSHAAVNVRSFLWWPYSIPRFAQLCVARRKIELLCIYLFIYFESLSTLFRVLLLRICYYQPRLFFFPM